MRLQGGDGMLCALYFVGDRIVMAGEKVDLSYMVRKLQEAYEQRGVIVNTKKSEYMIFGNSEKEDVPLEDGCVSGANECKYLGVVLNENCNNNQEINSTVKRCNIIRSVNSLSWDKNLRKITKKVSLELWYSALRYMEQNCGK
jgi:hypothetical protein